MKKKKRRTVISCQGVIIFYFNWVDADVITKNISPRHRRILDVSRYKAIYLFNLENNVLSKLSYSHTGWRPVVAVFCNNPFSIAGIIVLSDLIFWLN